MAAPCKTKLDEEPLNANDIKNLIKHSNYTNKYLQALKENIGKKTSSKLS